MAATRCASPKARRNPRARWPRATRRTARTGRPNRLSSSPARSSSTATAPGSSPKRSPVVPETTSMRRECGQVGNPRSDMSAVFREITEADVPDLFVVRTSTDENRMSRDELAAIGYTEAFVKEKLRGEFKGWLCAVDGRPVGFTMGNRLTGEMLVIAVLPAHVNQGIGSRLLALTERWLFANGNKRIWLTTDTDTRMRAYSFYRKNGWVDKEIKGGLRYMVKTAQPLGVPESP
ncbi:MAG: GNAT family N-acetyltransferase [Chitinivibrionales bacterium]|nr:GNAT family N-acetyltransferase [Chitinivibrionales bacterium]